MKQYRLFFSWQNDRTEFKTIISSALKKIAKKLADEDIELVIDQDTRDRIGVRNIAIEVLDKISKCDIFVADLTPITVYKPKESNKLPKFMPNSNVMFELGYALHAKGESRVIALASLNKSENEFIELLPFDINHFTITPFMNEGGLKGLGCWVKKIITDIDEERNSHVPPFDCSLCFLSNEIFTNEITINPFYKHIHYTPQKEENKGTNIPGISPNPLAPILNIQQLFGKLPKTSLAETINYSLAPLKLVFKNMGAEPLDNLKIQIVTDNENVTFAKSNIVDSFSSIWDETHDDLFISEKSITQESSTLNPDDSISLRTFYIHVPHDLDKLELHWKLTSRRYKKEGTLYIHVAPQYFTETKEDNILIGKDKVEDFIKKKP